MVGRGGDARRRLTGGEDNRGDWFGRYVIALISAASVMSPWVQKELQLAMHDEIVGRRSRFYRYDSLTLRCPCS